MPRAIAINARSVSWWRWRGHVLAFFLALELAWSHVLAFFLALELAWSQVLALSRQGRV